MINKILISLAIISCAAIFLFAGSPDYYDKSTVSGGKATHQLAGDYLVWPNINSSTTAYELRGGSITKVGTVDGRDVSADGAVLDAIVITTGTFLTKSSATATYVQKAGDTMTGTLNGTHGSFESLHSSGALTTSTYNVDTQFGQVATDTTSLRTDLNTEITDRENADIAIGVTTGTLRTDITALQVSTGNISAIVSQIQIDTGTLRTELNEVITSTGNLQIEIGTNYNQIVSTYNYLNDRCDTISASTGAFVKKSGDTMTGDLTCNTTIYADTMYGGVIKSTTTNTVARMASFGNGTQGISLGAPVEFGGAPAMVYWNEDGYISQDGYDCSMNFLSLKTTEAANVTFKVWSWGAGGIGAGNAQLLLAADYTNSLGKIGWDGGAFCFEVESGDTIFNTGIMRPETTDTTDLGTDGVRFKDLWLSGEVQTADYNMDEQFALVATDTTTLRTDVDAKVKKVGDTMTGTLAGTDVEMTYGVKTSTFQMTNGATNGYILQSDSDGNAVWALPTWNGIAASTSVWVTDEYLLNKGTYVITGTPAGAGDMIEANINTYTAIVNTSTVQNIAGEKTFTENTYGIVPTGSIISYSTTTAPTGFLYCDGSAVSTTTYSDLYDVIAFKYGNPGSGDMNIPDLRGMFLRGMDDGAGRDPETDRVVGSTQTDTMQGHYHNRNISGETEVALKVGTGNTFDSGSAGIYTTYTKTSSPITDGVNGTPRTSNETRPENMAVSYIIKY